MGFFDGIKKLTQPFEDDDDFYDDDEMETPLPVNAQADAPVQEKKSSFFSAGSETAGTSQPAFTKARREPRENKVVDLGPTGTQMKVVLVTPDSFEAAAEIADQLREKRPVLMNLEKTQKDVARRLIDFLSGVAYALEGKIKRVATNTYIITPYNVDIMGAEDGEPDSSELYF
ncbi:MAG TPA: cell division protein SepF [Oscillospiraceae bacterium]|nr:cell division protein SepF [Oscillospiraceae bacterium]HNY00852.1 cell division protein SepF [Oscillospiraceae bacterium]HPS74903.1 cell division protein SepF [Oscillospiraceae bacterium]